MNLFGSYPGGILEAGSHYIHFHNMCLDRLEFRLIACTWKAPARWSEPVRIHHVTAKGNVEARETEAGKSDLGRTVEQHDVAPNQHQMLRSGGRSRVIVLSSQYSTST